MGKSTRLILAEDHTILREGLRAILASEEDLQVVGEATDGREAVRCVQNSSPDLAVIDLSMPRMNGMEAVAEIKRVSPATRVLVLTVHKTEEYVRAALRAGADGYVLKDATSGELLVAVRSVLAGHRYLSPEISGKIIDGYLDGCEPALPLTPYDELSRREREVLKLIAEGYRNKDIAEIMCISVKTVEKHRSSLTAKLGIKNVPALVAYAVDKGLVVIG